jgi:hypothetical protein
VTAAGALSAGDLEKYVRWLRRTAIDGVLLWTEVGSGADLDLTEREELYTVWRGGLLPHQQVWVEVPAGGINESPEEVLFQATHARELGADGVVLRGENLSADLQHLASGDFRIESERQGSALTLTLSYAAAAGAALHCDAALADVSSEDVALVLLAVLAERKVISKASGFTIGGNSSLDLSKSAAQNAWNCLRSSGNPASHLGAE